MAKKAEAEEAFRRIEAEKSALETTASMLAPQLRSLEEGRATLQGLRREGARVTAHLSSIVYLPSVCDSYDSIHQKQALIFAAECKPARDRSLEEDSKHMGAVLTG